MLAATEAQPLGARRGSSKNLKPRQSLLWRCEEEGWGARGRPAAYEGPAAAARELGGAVVRARVVSAGGASSRHPPRRSVCGGAVASRDTSRRRWK